MKYINIKFAGNKPISIKTIGFKLDKYSIGYLLGIVTPEHNYVNIEELRSNEVSELMGIFKILPRKERVKIAKIFV